MIDSSLTLVQTLTEHQILTPVQLEELGRNLTAAYPEAQPLARELMKRGWLTAYQANRLFQGRTSELFLGPYVLLETLGEGGMGQVFKARHRLMNRVVALKVIRKERLGNSGAADRFVREIQAVAHLSHPNIVIAHDADRAGDVLYFSMEYIAGCDLDKVVNKLAPQPLPVGVACDYTCQAARGLQHAHERGLIHRDIKPANLLLAERDGVVKILDMGLARLSLADTPVGGALTHEGNLMGTPDYMAPEQAMDCHAADGRADIYSLGCTLYFLLAGRAPFADRGIAQKIGAHLNHEPRPIEELRPGLPKGLGDVLRKMMAKQPEQRFQTAGEVVAALDVFATKTAIPVAAFAASPTLAHQSVLATVTTDGTPTPEMAQAHRILPADPIPTLRIFDRWTRRQLLLGGLATGLAVLAPVAYRFRPRPQPIRPIEDEAQFREPWYPKELLKVLGDDRGRHWGAVRTAAYQADGKIIVSGGDDTVVRLWHSDTLREKRLPLRSHTATVRQVAFSPDGRYVVSLGSDGKMLLWDAETGKEVRGFSGSESISHLHFSADGQSIRGIATQSLHLWETTTGGQSGYGLPTEAALNCLDVLLGGQLFVFGESPPNTTSWFQVRIWNFDTKTFVHTLPGNAKPAGFATLNPADQAKIPSQSLVTVSIGQAGRRVIGVTNLGEVILWDVSATPRQISLLRQEGVSCARISPDGSLAVVYHRDGTLQVWEIEGAKKRGDLTGHQGAVVDCTFSPDSKHALTVSDDRTLRQWDLATCKELCPRTGHTHRVEDVTFSDDGQRLLSGGADKTMRLWDLKKGKEKAVEIRSFVHKAGVSSVGFLPREEEVFSTEASQTARRWEVADGRIVFSFPWAPSSSPVVMLYSRKHPHAYIAQSQGSVCCVDLLSGKQVSPGATPTPTSASCLAVSADGRRVLFAGTDPLVRYADLVEGRELKRFGGHTDTVHAVAFAEEERYVLSAGKDRRLRRWESRGNGKVDREVELQGPLPKIITSMAFSPDGKLLACAGFNDYEGVVTLWDIDGKLRNHWQLPGPVQRLTFADDSIHFATANANGTVYIYRIDRVGKG